MPKRWEEMTADEIVSELNSIVSVAISKTPAAPSLASFGTPLLLGEAASAARARARHYRNREQLVSAGFSMKANDATWIRKLRNRRRRAMRIRRGWR